ncbi:MAG: 50S ribosomal protein L6 [Bacteroidia bacterium]|nr:50S ribosomal protein L6 [Bacteroidia bacterium]MCZ2278244.1 50S ribosomal protein L6 [Bacteroidia bacterium]
MSRIGKAPIQIPPGVQVSVDKNKVTVKGPKGTLVQHLNEGVGIEINGNVISLTRKSEEKQHKAQHGLYRSLIANMVKGVTEGYKIEQELVGVGYRASSQGQQLDLILGFSHHVIFQLPSEVKVATRQERGANPIITLESHDKQLLGAVAAKIRSLREPEPYKGKGIKFVNEVLRRKAGKSAAKK